MAKQKAVYAGSFDPPTHGHVDIVKRAARIFDEVVVVVAENIKKKCLFTIQERLDMVSDLFSKTQNVKVDSYSGLVVEYCKKHGVQTLIRGIRSITDYEYEASMSRLNRELNAQVDTAFFMAQKEYVHLKSDMVKEIAQFGGDLSHMLPDKVAKKLMQRLRSS